jgi:head-tail adaptor
MANNTSGFKPKSSRQTRTAVRLLKPTATNYHGVQNQSYPSTGDVVYVNWKSFGGTDSVVNGVYSVIDTAQVTMRYRPDVKAGCRFLRSDGSVYEIKGEPENVDLANLWLICRLERVKGSG